MDLLGKEQADDDAKKAYCESKLDEAEDQLKELDGSLSDLKKDIANEQDFVGHRRFRSIPTSPQAHTDSLVRFQPSGHWVGVSHVVVFAGSREWSLHGDVACRPAGSHRGVCAVRRSLVPTRALLCLAGLFGD